MSDSKLPRAETGAGAGTEGQRVTAALRLDLLEGRYDPGEPLRQDALAERYAATRMPVREALRRLQAEGLVQVKGSRAQVTQLDPDEFAALYMMRERLEPLALIESLPRLRASDWDRLDAIQDQIEATNDVAEFLRLDEQLHMTSYSGCRAKVLTDTVTSLWNATQPYRRAYMQGADHTHRAEMVNLEHRLLIDAIRRRDETDAERVLKSHIHRTRVELTLLQPAGG